jgi:hypothetical protein
MIQQSNYNNHMQYEFCKNLHRIISVPSRASIILNPKHQAFLYLATAYNNANDVKLSSTNYIYMLLRGRGRPSKSQVKKLEGMDSQILVEASTPYQRNF